MSAEFTREEILKAIQKIDADPKLRTNRHSSTYDLVFNKNTYPPILVLSVANVIKNGTELTLQDYDNNVNVPFNILKDLGFMIETKNKKGNIDNREEFKIWLLENLTEKSGAGPSYITSIDWLSERFYEANKINKKSIFEIDNIDLINQLHSEVKNIQGNPKSFIYNNDAPSYGKNYFYSASLKKYIEFLKLRSSNSSIKKESIPEKVLYKNKSIREFAKYVFTYFYGENLLEVINQSSKSNPSTINETNYIFHDFGVFKRLIGEFETEQTKESLTSSKTIRFFEDPIYTEPSKYYYFSTQWYGVGKHDLTFQNLKSFFENEFPEYHFSNNNGVFSLYKSGAIKSDPFRIDAFIEKLKDSGLIFSSQLITRFCASLITKPFLILTGLSGSGKTKLAQAFVQWISENDSQYKIVPVGADWTNREPLLGYPNGLKSTEYITPDSGVLHLLLKAAENDSKPHFIILDEMNLSHVERYFADFLSIMESNDTIKLYSGSDRKSLDGIDIKQKLGWPKNVFIIGTVNIDETTYMFSPKVLDRANVIEFRITENEIAAFFENPMIPDLSKLESKGANMGENFLTLSAASVIVKNEELSKDLSLFFSELKKIGAEFGYRTASEIMQLIAKLKALEPNIDDNTCLDISIMQKLLPKLHGSRSKLVKVLIGLSALCIIGKTKEKEEFIKNFEIHFKNEFKGIEIQFKISFEKLIRMYINVLANGFTSYAEA